MGLVVRTRLGTTSRDKAGLSRCGVTLLGSVRSGSIWIGKAGRDRSGGFWRGLLRRGETRQTWQVRRARRGSLGSARRGHTWQAGRG
jgi:hypothetical protein